MCLHVLVHPHTQVSDWFGGGVGCSSDLGKQCAGGWVLGSWAWGIQAGQLEGREGAQVVWVRVGRAAALPVVWGWLLAGTGPFGRCW